ncbi:MAG TPA: CCA tRNA nucleotidyltransferase [Alphaproteobacteria bacterium]
MTTLPKQLPVQPWMTAPETQAVVAALTRDGGQVRFVGGCVRDALLGREVRDVDLATPDPPQVVVERLEAAGIRAIPTGIEHGTVTAVVGEKHFEITTLRRDVENFGRRARVAFTADWDADAARRDFTINALSAEPDGTLHDPFGGLADLAAGRVRFVGEPETRIREDVLRLLRFFRFHAYYGRGAPDAAALDACARLADLLPTLSGERIAGETTRLMLAPDPASAIELMTETGVLPHVLPEFTEVARLRFLVVIEDDLGDRDSLRRMAALIPAGAVDRARDVARRLRLSNADAERLAAMVGPPIRVTPDLDAHERRRALHRLGAPLFRDLVLLDWAESAGDATGHRELLAEAATWTPVVLPVRGQDVLDLGIPPGPEVGRLITAVEQWWEANDYRPGRAECLERLRQLARPPAGDAGREAT